MRQKPERHDEVENGLLRELGQARNVHRLGVVAQPVAEVDALDVERSPFRAAVQEPAGFLDELCESVFDVAVPECYKGNRDMSIRSGPFTHGADPPRAWTGRALAHLYPPSVPTMGCFPLRTRAHSARGRRDLAGGHDDDRTIDEGSALQDSRRALWRRRIRTDECKEHWQVALPHARALGWHSRGLHAPRREWGTEMTMNVQGLRSLKLPGGASPVNVYEV